MPEEEEEEEEEEAFSRYWHLFGLFARAHQWRCRDGDELCWHSLFLIKSILVLSSQDY